MHNEQPRPQSERWATPLQGRQVNRLAEFRETEAYQGLVREQKRKLLSVPPLGAAAAMTSETRNAQRQNNVHGRHKHQPRRAVNMPDPSDPKWVHADVLNSLHEVVALFPGSAATRNAYKAEMFQLIEAFYGSPYDTSKSIVAWYNQASFAIEMAVKSVREERSGQNDRCTVPGLTDKLAEAIEACVAENAGLTLEQYRNPTPSGDTDMTILDADNQPNNKTASPAAVRQTPPLESPVTAAADLAAFEQSVRSFPGAGSTNPVLTPENAQVIRAVHLAPARMYDGNAKDGEGVGLAIHNQGGEGDGIAIEPTPASTETIIHTTNQEPTDMTTSATEEILGTQTGERLKTAAAAANLASGVLNHAKETLKDAGDQMHAAAKTIDKVITKPSMWKKVRKAAAITAGVAAVGGAAYMAYRYFKDGQTPAATVDGALDAAKQVVDRVTNS